MLHDNDVVMIVTANSEQDQILAVLRMALACIGRIMVVDKASSWRLSESRDQEEAGFAARAVKP